MMEGHLQTDKLSQFIVNKEPYCAICGEINSNMGSAIPQPVLIIGQEGSGKTTLLKHIISTYPHVRHVWIDGRSIFSSEAIIDQSKDVSIVVIDNLDYYLERCSYEEQFKLRRFLYNEGAPMLIACVRKLYQALTEYKAPFFEGLKKIHLPLVLIEDLTFLFDKQSIERAKIMFNLISPTIKSVEIIYNIIEINSDPDKDIDMLLSHFSEKYSLMYQNLPVNSQHILNIFGDVDSGLTIPEIRDRSNLASGILTPYLNNLCRQGFVTVDKSVKRNTKYFINDPLFRIWLKKG